MAKPKDKSKKLKRLKNQLKARESQPTTIGKVRIVDKGKPSEHAEYGEYLTMRGRLEQRIKTLENTKQS